MSKQEDQGAAAVEVPTEAQIINAAVESMESEESTEPSEAQEATEGAVETAETPEKAEAKDGQKAEGADAPAENKDGEETVSDKSWKSLIEREKKHRQEVEAFRKEREETGSEFDGLRNENKSLRESIGGLREDITKDPMGFLQKYGGIKDFEELAQRVLNKNAASPGEIARKTAELAETKFKTAEERMASLEAKLQQQEQERYIREYESSIREAISGDKYDLLRHYPGGAEAAVLVRAQQIAASDGVVLQPSEIADRLQEEFREELAQLASYDAVRAAMGLEAGKAPPSTPGQNGKAEPNKTPGHRPKTMSNSLASMPSKSIPVSDWAMLSEEEQINEAAKLVSD